MAQQYFNLVTFTASTESGTKRLYLTLSDDWTFGPGIEPSVNTALVPFAEFDKLGGDVADVVGDVEFWFHNTPGAGAPDAKYQQIRLVDVEATKFGTPVTLTPEGKIQGGSLDPRPVEYKLTFADRREAWTWPRGGVLDQGEINKEPLDDGGGFDANVNGVKGLGQLVRLCLKAMGASDAVVPLELELLQPPTNIEWRMSHAPTELKKLLAPTNYVLTLSSAARLSIVPIGEGSLPVIANDQKLPVYTTPVVDRRGKYVVFTSGPNGTLSTETISGGKGDAEATTWQFVILDPLVHQWVPQEEAACFVFTGKTPADAIKDDGYPWIPEADRGRVVEQLYRYIRLNPKVYGPAPIQTSVRDSGDASNGEPLSKDSPVTIRAVVARPGPDRFWANTADKVTIDVVAMVGNGQILKAAERLCKISTPQSLDPLNDFKALDDGDLEVRLTREVFVQGDEGAWSPSYFNVGFGTGINGPEQIKPDDLQAVLAGPAPTIVRRPELVLRLVDGAEENRADLVKKAEPLAARFLRNSSAAAKIVTARGFASAEVNGLVAEVKISQSNLLTTLKVNTWWLPSSEHYVTAEEIERATKGDDKFPKQAETQAAKISDGHSGATQPSLPVLPASTSPAAAGDVLVKVTGNAAGAGKYTGGVVGGTSNAAPAPNELLPEGMTDPAKSPLLILNLAEDGQTNPIVKHRLPTGYYVGKPIGSGTGGPVVAIDSHRCGATGSTAQIGVNDPAGETADTTSVEAVDTKLVQETRLSRVAYNASGDKILYAFFRVYNYACGRLTDISGEFRRTVVSTAPCDGGT